MKDIRNIPTGDHQYRPVAQLAERPSPKREVVGSIPAWPASEKKNAAFGGVLAVK